MKVTVVKHYQNNDEEIFSGPEDEIAKQLHHRFGFLARNHKNASVDELVAYINKQQAYSCYIEDGGLILKSEAVKAQMGTNRELERVFRAAAFLGTPAEELDKRRAMKQAAGDVYAAALIAHGLPVDEEHLKALQAVLDTDKLSKSEWQPPKKAEAIGEVSKAFADMVNRAIKTHEVDEIDLGGKHSAGAMVAYDRDTQRTLLLKPGSGPQSPAMGARHSGASQTKREAAFWAVASAWGLGETIPETHILMIDGKEYAAIEMLTPDFKTSLEAQHEDPAGPRRMLNIYLQEGLLHKWSILDFVLGNSDRHAQNVMVRGKDVKLIDHGAAFAGAEFSPQNDEYTFVPYYLRAFAPNAFDALSAEEKLKVLPRMRHRADEVLEWLNSIDEEQLKEILSNYGIDFQPIINRLHRVKELTAHGPADLAALQVWVLS